MAGLELKYFILKPKGTSGHAIASRVAMLAYAEASTNPELAKDIKEWATKEQSAVEKEERRQCGCGH